MFDQLPPEFAALQEKIQWVKQITANEYHSSCPVCGVEPHHSDANPSNRFVMWVESRTNGKPFGFCRRCGHKWTHGKQDVVWTDEEKAAFQSKRRELNQREEERVQEYARNVIMRQGIYRTYMQNLSESTYGKQYLTQRGFTSDEWNRWFGYGILNDYKCKGEHSTYYTPAITMPVIGMGFVVENVKLRVTEAHHPNDRFRNIYKTKAQHVHFPMRDKGIENKVLVVEGEMKANMVAMRVLNGKDDLQVVGSQGMGIGARMVYALESAEVIYLCLDPDTYQTNKHGKIPVLETARKFGLDRVRLVRTPLKVDDAILQGFNVRNAINMAIKPSQL